jgi:hypothetical protein
MNTKDQRKGETKHRLRGKKTTQKDDNLDALVSVVSESSMRKNHHDIYFLRQVYLYRA